jgi:hypothetical protein
MSMNALEKQVSTQAAAVRKDSQLNDEIRLFFQPSNDNKFYHVTCKFILHDSLYDYDYEFFYEQSSNVRYHVTCKSLSHMLIINILNKEIYGRDFDVNNLKRNDILLIREKLNLELNLKKVLPFYLYIPGSEMRSDSNESMSSFQHENTESDASSI